MPDISMCGGKGCNVRQSCYRYRAVPSKFMQSYARFDDDAAKCTHYWPIEDGDRLMSLSKLKRREHMRKAKAKGE